MKKILPLIASLLFLASCSSEYHYANSYLRKFRHESKKAVETIYVCLPSSVYHTNTSLNAIPNFAYMPTSKQDSLIAAYTNILDKINDSIFLDQFRSSLLFTLSRARIPIVVVDDASQLPPTSPTQLTLHVAELEAEEFLQSTRSDFYTKKGVYYAYDYNLRHFATNAWFIFDNTDTTQSVYFKNYEVQDNFQGTVVAIKDKKASMKAHFDRITLNDAYATARELGTLCATLYIERILAEHVKRSAGTNDQYFLYNPIANEINVIIPYEMGMQDSFEKL